MTIESASHPSPLSRWDGNAPESPFCVEIFGETEPLINTCYSELVGPGRSPAETQTSSSAPIYKYWWTLGHPGHPDHYGLERCGGQATLWERLPNEPPAYTFTSRWAAGGE